MANPSKVIGTKGETKVKRYLTEHGFPTERKALAGSSDKGDLRMVRKDGSEVTVEVKAGRQTDGYPRGLLRIWQEQTDKESANSGWPAILVIVRYRRSMSDAEVWMRVDVGHGSEWVMTYLDDYVRMQEEIGG